MARAKAMKTAQGEARPLQDLIACGLPDCQPKMCPLCEPCSPTRSHSCWPQSLSGVMRIRSTIFGA